jgi:transcriptional regulator with XRE-family HTH domain
VSGGETIGERLRRVREERGLTQRDIAAPGVSAQYVSKLERGQRIASVKALRKLAANLGVTWQYLETGAEPIEGDIRNFRLDEAELALRLTDDLDSAEATLRDVLAQAVSAGDARAATRARLALGRLAANRSDHREALEALEVAVAEPWVTPSTHADAFAALSHSYCGLGRNADAEALLQSCLDEAVRRRPANGAVTARFALLLSCALVDAGRIDEARDAIATGVRFGETTDDPYTLVRLYWANARVCASDGDIPQAQVSINRAIGLLELTEDRTNLARAHLLAAEFALWDNDLLEAADHLGIAERLLPAGCDVEDTAFLVVQQALVAARSGEAPRAMDLATAALQLLGEGVDPTIRGRAHWALAEAYAAAGADASARAAFTAASELIPPGSKHSERLLEAWQAAVPADA